jgi:hypothetical protein
MKDLYIAQRIIPPAGQIILVLSLIFLLGSGWACISKLQHLSHRYSTNGMVVNYDENADQGRYYPIVEFKDKQGKTHIFRDGTGASAPLYQTGTRVQVDYNPADPQQAEITTLYYRWGLTGGLLFIGILLFRLGLRFSEKISA